MPGAKADVKFLNTAAASWTRELEKVQEEEQVLTWS